MLTPIAKIALPPSSCFFSQLPFAQQKSNIQKNCTFSCTNGKFLHISIIFLLYIAS